MLIDRSYFTQGPRHILNATVGTAEANYNAGEVNAAIDAYIARWQPVFLKGVLGGAVAKAVGDYLAAIDDDAATEPVAAIDMVVEQLRQPFADYVFYKMLREVNTQATITGLVRLKCANEYAAPLYRQVAAWNSMAEQLADFASWSATDECTLPDIVTDTDFLTQINALNL